MHTKTIWIGFFLLLLNILTVSAQQNLQFSVVEFASDPFDTSARDERFKKIDGSGSLYAIIKVTSETPSDDLRAYNFDFGNMNHRVDDSHDGELWLYVQKNAKTVTISRQGYNTLRRYDLQTTIEEGRNYKMVLSAQGPVVYTQMVVFQVKPASARAVVTVQREGGQKEMFGTTDETGGVAKNMEFGTYTYEVVAENYHLSEGRFTPNNQNENHIEQVELRTNGAMMTLQVDADADIYVNNTKRGTRTWSGLLKAGYYQVECRQANHRSSSQTISVMEGNGQTIQLTPPTPITGILSVTTRPLGANIKIDGRDYGTSPRNIQNLLIGRHTLILSRDGYQQKSEAFDIRENETTTLDLAMEKSVANTSIANNNSSANSRTFTVNGVSFVMKRVEGGTFQMGATSEQGSDTYDREKPIRRVTLSGYYIGETEVTQALWQAVMGNNPSNFKGNSLPVESVSWSDCQEFIRKLNAQTGQRFRLPSEAEWEFAARGGKNSRGYKYSGSNTVKSVAWYAGNSNSSTHPVKTKQANELGLYDMSGNVWEWCQDWYGKYSSNAQTNPTGPTTGSNRVMRGGNWDSDAGNCRVSYRDLSTPSYRYSRLGLRLAL